MERRRFTKYKKGGEMKTKNAGKGKKGRMKKEIAEKKRGK